MCCHNIPSMSYPHTPQHSLYLEIALMPWGNKPPDSKAGKSCWDQRRAPPAPGQAQIRIIHRYTCCSSWAVLRTRSTGRTSHYCFPFRWGKGSAGTMKQVPRPRRPSQYRGRCNPVTLLHPEKRQHCLPTRINNPRAKLLEPFTCVAVAARGRWAEEPRAKCSSNTNHKKPLQFVIIYQHLCETGFSKPGDLLGYWSAQRGDKSRSRTSKTVERVLQEKLCKQSTRIGKISIMYFNHLIPW